MQSTRMPGFTAEAAHYPSATSYGSRAARPEASGVLPSLVAPGPGRCIPGCICVTPEGCPCCDSIFKPPWGRRVALNAGASNAGAPNAGSGRNLVAAFDAWCTDHGGGMASMPDGTVQCFL